jgi:hypothetical protein
MEIFFADDESEVPEFDADGGVPSEDWIAHFSHKARRSKSQAKH